MAAIISRKTKIQMMKICKKDNMIFEYEIKVDAKCSF